MQQILTDWLWKIEIKDPKYIKDEREGSKLIFAYIKFFKSLYEHKDWRSARKRLKEVQELYPKFDWGVFKYRLVYNTDD